MTSRAVTMLAVVGKGGVACRAATSTRRGALSHHAATAARAVASQSQSQRAVLVKPTTGGALSKGEARMPRWPPGCQVVVRAESTVTQMGGVESEVKSAPYAVELQEAELDLQANVAELREVRQRLERVEDELEHARRELETAEERHAKAGAGNDTDLKARAARDLEFARAEKELMDSIVAHVRQRVDVLVEDAEILNERRLALQKRMDSLPEEEHAKGTVNAYV